MSQLRVVEMCVVSCALKHGEIRNKEGTMSDTYRGKPIEELTREELVEALREMGKLYHDTLNRRATERANLRRFKEDK